MLRELSLDQIDTAVNDRKAFRREELAELADSISSLGVIEPIVVRPLPGDRFELVAGERRLRASRMAGLTHIPARVMEADDQLASRIMLVENLLREDLNPVEEADALKSRLDAGDNPEELAKALGMTVQRIRSRAALADLGPMARELLKAGQIAVWQATLLIRLDVNRQGLALGALNNGIAPRQFREYCSKLGEQQAQESLLNDLILTSPPVPEPKTPEHRLEGIPIPARELVFESKGFTRAGEAIETYILRLMDDGLDREAQAVSALYAALVSSHLVTRPPHSPLIERTERDETLD